MAGGLGGGFKTFIRARGSRTPSGFIFFFMEQDDKYHNPEWWAAHRQRVAEVKAERIAKEVAAKLTPDPEEYIQFDATFDLTF